MNPLALFRSRRQPLPEYSLKVSRRARRMWLRVSRWGRIEVVVPVRHSQAKVEDFVHENRLWIKRTLSEFNREYGPAPRMVLPTRLVVRATGETWTVKFRKVAGAVPRLREFPDQSLVIEAERLAPEVWAVLLRQWLQRHAKMELGPWLASVAQDMGLRYRRIQVRGQRTRWGSCSNSGTISLNYSLLFLPPRLVRYLMIHELSHLRHMDHSPRFWARVAEHCPQWKRLDSELRGARRLVPDWVELA